MRFQNYDVGGFLESGETDNKIRKDVWKNVLVICLIFLAIEYIMRIVKGKRRKYYV